MKLTTTIDENGMIRLVERISHGYADNLTLLIGTDFRRDKRWQHQFTLGVKDSFGPGARTSASGRHMPKASWQAHRDVLQAVFDADPEAKLVSSLATYDGAAAFERDFPATYYMNVGSQMSPRAIGDCAV